MILSAADRRNIILEEIRHQRNISAMREAELRHVAKRARDLDEAEKVKEHRKQTMLEHEAVNMAKREARSEEIVKHQEFLKSSLKDSLNIL